MVVTLGVNAGFVTTAPVSDPAGGNWTNLDGKSFATKDTSPSGATKIIEIGWWCDNATEEANFEVGLYDHNPGQDDPDNLLAGADLTNAKGTNAGWKVVTGLDITIQPETIYWVAAQIDNVDTATTINVSSTGRWVDNNNMSTLPDPWGVPSSTHNGNSAAIYALVETPAPSNINPKIKISGTFSTKPIKVKIGGTFVEKTLKVKVGGTFQ